MSGGCVVMDGMEWDGMGDVLALVRIGIGGRCGALRDVGADGSGMAGAWREGCWWEMDEMRMV